MRLCPHSDAKTHTHTLTKRKREIELKPFSEYCYESQNNGSKNNRPNVPNPNPKKMKSNIIIEGNLIFSYALQPTP